MSADLLQHAQTDCCVCSFLCLLTCYSMHRLTAVFALSCVCWPVTACTHWLLCLLFPVSVELLMCAHNDDSAISCVCWLSTACTEYIFSLVGLFVHAQSHGDNCICSVLHTSNWYSLYTASQLCLHFPLSVDLLQHVHNDSYICFSVFWPVSMCP